MELQEKNYTNPEDRGRFGFSRSGDYHTPFKAEGFLVALLIGAAVVAGMALLFAIGKINAQSQMEQESSSTFVFVGSAIALVAFVAILILIFGVGVRSVKKGFRCTYSANDETFTTTIGGDLHVIRYEDVTHINFEPRTSFGKVRGYDITIRVNNHEEHYAVCSDGYLSPQATPFFIIQERLDFIRRRSLSASVAENTMRPDTKAISRAEVDRAQNGSMSALDRMAQLLGETSNMPSLSADSDPASRAIARVNQMLSGDDEMPAVGEQTRNTYIGYDGRERDINETLEQGSFYVAPSKKLQFTYTFVAMLITAGIFALLVWAVIIRSIFGAILGMIPYAWILIPVLFVAVEFLAFYTCMTKLHGPLHNYRADGRGFYVTTKEGGNEQILYKDVLSVDYSFVRLLWGAYGYKVDILTTYGIVHYDYIYPRFNHKVPRQYLPFEPIRRNMPNKGAEETY